MRSLLAVALLAVAAVVLAGCAAGDDPTPPNADPNPSEPLPSTVSTNTTGPSTGTPTGSFSTSASSTSTGPASFPPHDEERSASDADFTGLATNGHLTGSGSLLRIEATANKFSPAHYRVPDGTCAKPWTESLSGPSGLVQARKPAATCQAFGLRDMTDNEAIATALTWNGTLWDSASGTYVRAPAGSYTWTATFHVYSGGSGSTYTESADLPLTFTVTVA